MKQRTMRKKNGVKQFLGLVMCLMLFVGVMPLTVSAEEVSGDYEYKINTDGTVTITEYTGLGGDVIIPEELDGKTVTVIGRNAFFMRVDLTSVTIPNSVISIDVTAFAGCEELTNINIPDSVTSIGDHAFDGCKKLTDITIPNSVTSIGKVAFKRCEGLTSVTLSENLTSIGDSTFGGCSGLTSITIPNSVISIEGTAFADCSELTSINIGDSVTDIAPNAFQGCNRLTSVTAPCGLDLTQAIPTSPTVTLKHKYQENVSYLDPTCTAEGYTGDTVCERCKDVGEKGTVLPKIAHNYKSGKCTVCGAVDPAYSNDPAKPGTEPSSKTDKKASPKTGDSNNIYLWFVMLFVSGAGVIAVTRNKKYR